MLWEIENQMVVDSEWDDLEDRTRKRRKHIERMAEAIADAEERSSHETVGTER